MVTEEGLARSQKRDESGLILRRWAARIDSGGIYLDAVDGHCADAFASEKMSACRSYLR